MGKESKRRGISLGEVMRGEGSSGGIFGRAVKQMFKCGKGSRGSGGEKVWGIFYLRMKVLF